MHLDRFARVLILLLFLAPATFAAAGEDLSGKWGGTFIVTVDQNPPTNDTAHMVAKHTGTEFTGTIGPNPEQQFTMAKGKVETVKVDGKDVTKVTFDIIDGPGGPNSPVRFTLTLVDGHLKGKAELDADGRKMSAAIDLTRIK